MKKTTHLFATRACIVASLFFCSSMRAANAIERELSETTLGKAIRENDIKTFRGELAKDPEKEANRFTDMPKELLVGTRLDSRVITPLMEASYLGRTDMVKELLQAGASRMAVSAPSGQIAIMYGVASKENNREIIEELLNTLKYGRTPSLNHEDGHGRSVSAVLFSAGGNIENFKKLMENGYGTSIKDTQGNTVAMLAKRYGRPDALALIVKDKNFRPGALNNANQSVFDFPFAEEVPEKTKLEITDILKTFKAPKKAPAVPTVHSLTAEKNILQDQLNFVLNFVQKQYGDQARKDLLEELRKHSPEKPR